MKRSWGFKFLLYACLGFLQRDRGVGRVLLQVFDVASQGAHRIILLGALRSSFVSLALRLRSGGLTLLERLLQLLNLLVPALDLVAELLDLLLLRIQSLLQFAQLLRDGITRARCRLSLFRAGSS